MNVHRWRSLESSDPKHLETLMHLQGLHKQLIKKCDEITERDVRIQETERFYMELKSVLSRQPGPEAQEQILLYEQALKTKLKQSRAMDVELELYIQQVEVFRDETRALDVKLEAITAQWVRDQHKR
jgi:hypothetical protein